MCIAYALNEADSSCGASVFMHDEHSLFCQLLLTKRGVAHLPAFSFGLLRPARQRGHFRPLCDLSTPSQKGNASRSFTMRLRCMPTNYSHFQRRPFLFKRGVSAPFPKPGRVGEARCINVRLVTRCSAGRALVWGMCKRPGDLMISRRFCRALCIEIT